MQHILLVEDDLSLIEGLEFSLKKNHFNVDIAKTAKEAIDKFYKKPYDLLLLDLSLPDGSGFEICKNVRQSSPIPIIFLTASDEEVNIVMGLDIGGDDYITKPFKLNELISRINALLRRAKLTDISVSLLKSNGITINLSENRVSGIHPDDIHHVFKRFYRSRFTSDKHGVGIGLALSKAIIEKHGGTITVESKLSKGTSFRLAFPKLTNL